MGALASESEQQVFEFSGLDWEDRVGRLSTKNRTRRTLRGKEEGEIGNERPEVGGNDNRNTKNYNGADHGQMKSIRTIREHFDNLKENAKDTFDPYGYKTLLPVEDAVCISGKDDTDLCEQSCNWGPSDEPSYFFPKDACLQAGSFLFRYSRMYLFCLACLLCVMTLVGVVVRIGVRPETWFFNPNNVDECFIWPWLRVIGP